MARHARNGNLLVLTLHQVNPDPNPFWPSVRPEHFVRLLEWLTSVAEPVTFSDLRARDGADRAKPLVILSFDDGYGDFVDYAMPILQDFGLHANQNVIGASVETGVPPREVQVCELLAAAPLQALNPLRLPRLTLQLGADDTRAKARFGAAVSNHIKSLDPEAGEEAWMALRDALGVDPPPTRMMSREDVATAVAAGHEIGGHAYHHQSMEHVDDAQFADDFERCRGVLADVGCQTRVYAFPNGSFRETQVDLLRRAGVEHVLLVGERPSHRDSDVHTRLSIRGRSPAELRARAAAMVPAR
jgi:peptidoglycan/xylan/chitin deacetylase (PgdA/CDA1 family)